MLILTLFPSFRVEKCISPYGNYCSAKSQWGTALVHGNPSQINAIKYVALKKQSISVFIKPRIVHDAASMSSEARQHQSRALTITSQSISSLLIDRLASCYCADRLFYVAPYIGIQSETELPAFTG